MTVKLPPPKNNADWQHQGIDGKPGVTPEEYANPDRLVWCPNVQEWMTAREHQVRFAPPGDQALGVNS